MNSHKEIAFIHMHGRNSIYITTLKIGHQKVVILPEKLQLVRTHFLTLCYSHLIGEELCGYWQLEFKFKSADWSSENMF